MPIHPTYYVKHPHCYAVAEPQPVPVGTGPIAWMITWTASATGEHMVQFFDNEHAAKAVQCDLSKAVPPMPSTIIPLTQMGPAL